MERLGRCDFNDAENEDRIVEPKHRNWIYCLAQDDMEIDAFWNKWSKATQ